MKKSLAIISWIIAGIGVIATFSTTWFINNCILLWVGISMMIIGSIGVLLFGDKSRQFIANLFDFL